MKPKRNSVFVLAEETVPLKRRLRSRVHFRANYNPFAYRKTINFRKAGEKEIYDTVINTQAPSYLKNTLIFFKNTHG